MRPIDLELPEPSDARAFVRRRFPAGGGVWLVILIFAGLFFSGLFFAGLAVATTPDAVEPTPAAMPEPASAAMPEDMSEAMSEAEALAQRCALLDNPETRGRLDGLLLVLLHDCDRLHELGRVRQEVADPVTESLGGGTDVPVNDPSGDEGLTSHTQSETALARNENDGTLCSGYNDSAHIFSNEGVIGFSRSTDGGATFDDRGPLGSQSFSDPTVVWRHLDGNFYFAALVGGGIGVWRSTDDCQTFQFLGNTTSGGSDKEFMTVDNDPSSPFYGRLYIAWTDFSGDSSIEVNYSADAGVTWSTPVSLSDPGASIQNAWPTVAPNGDVYVAWVRWNPFPNGPVDIEISRSTDGGDTFTRVANPSTNRTNPRDATASETCNRPALKGNIRYSPGPQLEIDDAGTLHVVYSYDPDGFDTGDVIDVFYRRSTDQGATWGPEMRLNDDTTTSDQYFPTLSVRGDRVVATWYDRRLDPDNLLIDHYQRTSLDGGDTWEPSQRVSDVSTPIYLDPFLLDCYHGDYDQNVQTDTTVVVQWADDRNVQDGHNDPDVYVEVVPFSSMGEIFADGFESGDTSSWSNTSP